jgi:hypothetical protein
VHSLSVFKQMKYCYKCKQSKELDLFGKNKSRKDGLADECRPCKQQQDREYAAQHREEAKQRASKWYYSNKEYANTQHKIYGFKWRKENKDKNTAKENRRRALKLHATPSWLTKEQHQQIDSFYWLAKLQEELTDTKYHVDHIVPLKGKTVCGLHVPWNLQLLSAKDNLSKSNKV